MDRVERQRVEAQDELSRNREKIRRLSQTLAVEHALEDGRRAGFEEGLKQGRVYQQATSVSWDDIYDVPSRKRRSRQPEADQSSEVSSYSYPGEGSSSGSSHTSREKYVFHSSVPNAKVTETSPLQGRTAEEAVQVFEEAPVSCPSFCSLHIPCSSRLSRHGHPVIKSHRLDVQSLPAYRLKYSWAFGFSKKLCRSC